MIIDLGGARGASDGAAAGAGVGAGVGEGAAIAVVGVALTGATSCEEVGLEDGVTPGLAGSDG